MQQPFPKAGEDYPDAERDMTRIMDVIRAIRNIRSEMHISPAATIETICYTDDEQTRKLLTSHEGYIKGLAKVSHLKVSAPAERPENAATAIAANVEIFVPLKGLINFDEEEKRLAKDIEKIIKEVEAVQKKLSNRGFLDRAPKEVVTKEQTRVEELLQKKEKLEEGSKKVKMLRQN